MIQAVGQLHRALCEPCGYRGKWKSKRHEAVVAMQQHECSGKHRRRFHQRMVRLSA